MAKKPKFLLVRQLAFLTFALVFSQNAAADESYNILVQYQSGDFAQINMLITHNGTITLKDAERDDAARSLPLHVDAKIKYDQRFTGRDNLLAIRAYDPSTHAKIKVSDGKRNTVLTDKNRYVIARLKKQGPIQSASLEDVLNQTEADLITNPADPLSFAKLFDKTNVKIGDQWDAPDEALSTFLSVDRVYENKVRLELRDVTDNRAKIYIVGAVKTEVDDVTNEITVSASALIDLQSHKLLALRASLQQDRLIGQIAPGFKGTTKVDLRINTKDELDSLSNKEIAKRTKSRKIERKLKWQPDNADFNLLYDPRWHVIASADEGAVFRYLNNGTLMAQCNIVQLPSRPAGILLTLAGFKTEVVKIIAKEKTARVADAKQHTTRNGIQALGVRVEGSEQEVPVTWLYYHLSHDDGRQLTFVFTLENDIADEFQPADKKLLDAFAFLDNSDDAKSKKPVAKTRSAKKQSATRKK